ncbi:MAG: potassium transporter TrkG, partial [Lachnospiraceae bacterium]|nr:potassium transporter TrkG [Lachnospiraceae bacterium]
MNYAIIGYILGWVLTLESMFMVLPCIVAVIYRESAGFAFLIVAAVCFAAGMLIVRKRPRNQVYFAREGFVTVALCWIVMSIFGALPFVINGDIPSFTDALFETISGFTTTGASILSDVEALSYCSLFWRSFTHWIGGMGVLVFLLAVLPLAGGYNMHLMRAESPGPSVGKLVPKVRET